MINYNTNNSAIHIYVQDKTPSNYLTVRAVSKTGII